MIKKYEGYDTQTFGERKYYVPKGGYVMLIKSVENFEDKGYIKVSGDIAEGDYALFYTKKFNKNDSPNRFWDCYICISTNTWRFGKLVHDLKASNPGYVPDAGDSIDEKSFVRKYVGGLFINYEYKDGKFRTKWKATCSVEQIHSGWYTDHMPKDESYRDKGHYSQPSGIADFMKIDDGAADELPFR